LLLFLRISDGQAAYLGKGRELVFFCRRLVHDVHDDNPAREQGISDERAVASPGQCFSTHDRRGLLFGRFDEGIQTQVKILRLHVVSEPPERGVFPGGVDRVFLRVAKPSEVGQVFVTDAVFP